MPHTRSQIVTQKGNTMRFMLREWDEPVVLPRTDIDGNHVVVLPNGRKAVWNNGVNGQRIRSNKVDPELLIPSDQTSFWVVGVQGKTKPRPW